MKPGKKTFLPPELVVLLGNHFRDEAAVPISVEIKPYSESFQLQNYQSWNTDFEGGGLQEHWTTYRIVGINLKDESIVDLTELIGICHDTPSSGDKDAVPIKSYSAIESVVLIAYFHFLRNGIAVIDLMAGPCYDEAILRKASKRLYQKYCKELA